MRCSDRKFETGNPKNERVFWPQLLNGLTDSDKTTSYHLLSTSSRGLRSATDAFNAPQYDLRLQTELPHREKNYLHPPTSPHRMKNYLPPLIG